MNLYYHIKATAGAGEYVVCPKPCILHAITVNKTVNNIITIYDGAVEVGILAANVAEKTYFYDVDIGTYLKIVNEGNSDLTISYRPSGAGANT